MCKSSCDWANRFYDFSLDANAPCCLLVKLSIAFSFAISSGQYLQIRIHLAGGKLQFSDILAFDEAPIVISSSTDISLQDISEHDSNSLFRVFENFDPS